MDGATCWSNIEPINPLGLAQYLLANLKFMSFLHPYPFFCLGTLGYYYLPLFKRGDGCWWMVLRSLMRCLTRLNLLPAAQLRFLPVGAWNSLRTCRPRTHYM